MKAKLFNLLHFWKHPIWLAIFNFGSQDCHGRPCAASVTTGFHKRALHAYRSRENLHDVVCFMPSNVFEADRKRSQQRG